MKNKVKFLVTMGATFLASSALFASSDEGSVWNAGIFAIAAALAIGLAALGGTLGQGRVGAAALEGIARNPGASGKIFVPMILGMALIESLVLFALIIAFTIVGKI